MRRAIPALVVFAVLVGLVLFAQNPTNNPGNRQANIASRAQRRVKRLTTPLELTGGSDAY